MNLQLPCTVNVIGYAKIMHALICMEADGYCMAGISLFLHRGGGLLSHPHPPMHNATETLLHSSLHCPEPVWLCYNCSYCAVILRSSSFEFAFCRRWRQQSEAQPGQESAAGAVRVWALGQLP